jgi:hypothetical protein
MNLENEARQKDLNMEDLRGRINEVSMKRMQFVEDNKFLNVEIENSLDVINELSAIQKEVPYKIIH